MQRTVFFGEERSSRDLPSTLGGTELVPLTDRNELAYTLVRSTDILLAVIEPSTADGRMTELLRSIEQTFPMLHLVVLGDYTSARPQETEAQGRVLSLSPVLESWELVRRLEGFIGELTLQNRRRHARFDWPLQGRIAGNEPHGEEAEGETHNVRALSAGGAYLEEGRRNPAPGSRNVLEVHFRNFRMRMDCEVLDRRAGSSNLPPGFGIRFRNLSAEAEAFIDRVVQDALMRILLDPTAEPDVPSLGEERLELSLGDEFRLDPGD